MAIEMATFQQDSKYTHTHIVVHTTATVAAIEASQKKVGKKMDEMKKKK